MDMQVRLTQFSHGGGCGCKIAPGVLEQILAKGAPGLVRAAMHRAHLLVHPSIMEGGANVVAEAVTARTAVAASRISGNVGMLGAGYAGYFEPRDAAGLATILGRLSREPAALQLLERQCAARRPLFDPRREARAVRGLVAELLASNR